MKKFYSFLIILSLVFSIFPATSSAHNGKKDELGGHYRSSDCMYLLHTPTELAKSAKNIEELIALIKKHNSNTKCGNVLTADKVDLEGYVFPIETTPPPETPDTTDKPETPETPETPDTTDKPETSETTTSTNPILKGLNVHYIDVGQGDATYIRTPEGDDILIDAGSKDSGDKVVAYLKKQKVDDIEVMISTHPDADHVGGLDEVLAAFKVEAVYAPKVSHTTQAYKDFLTAVKREKVTIKTAKAGVAIALMDKSVIAKFIAPVKEYSKTDLNNWSAVVHLNYNKTNFLFMGDAELKSEKDLITSKTLSKVDVLKVGHHGAKESSSAAFLKLVKPTYSIISVGAKNQYKHPTKEALNNLGTVKSKVFRTDQKGTIVVNSTGTKITLSTEKK